MPILVAAVILGFCSSPLDRPYQQGPMIHEFPPPEMEIFIWSANGEFFPFSGGRGVRCLVGVEEADAISTSIYPLGPGLLDDAQ